MNSAPGRSVRLAPLPERFAETRVSLHRVAEQLVAPARKPDNEISLRATPGGFGTPPFEFQGAEYRVRVEGAELVLEVGGEERRTALGSLREAARLLADLLPEGTELDDDPLTVDPASARALGDWYAFGAAVLEELRSAAASEDAPTSALLWPEHFDIAIELGPNGQGRRANYGLSPGDEHHPEPYLYVGPWSAEVSGELWNATGFTGAEMSHAELLAVEDQRAAAVDFCLARKRALDGQ